MARLMRNLTTATLAVLFVLPAIGCRQDDKGKPEEKRVDVQVDAGKTKVKVEGTKTPGDKPRVEVDVERHADHNSGEHDK